MVEPSSATARSSIPPTDAVPDNAALGSGLEVRLTADVDNGPALWLPNGPPAHGAGHRKAGNVRHPSLGRRSVSCPAACGYPSTDRRRPGADPRDNLP